MQAHIPDVSVDIRACGWAAWVGLWGAFYMLEVFFGLNPCVSGVRRPFPPSAWGEKGCLYENAPNQLAAILYSASGDEKLVTGIKPKEAERWAKRLEVQVTATEQLSLAGAGQ